MDAPRQLTRDSILDAGEEVLRHYGPTKATVLDVARALQVSHGSGYRHFTSKADLRDAVAQRWLDRICAPLDQIADGPGDASTRLHDWLVALSTTKQQMATSDPALFATFRQLTLAARAVTAAHVDRLSGQLARIVDSGITTGEFEPCDPASTGRALLHATARFHHPALDIEWHDPDLRPQLETVCTLLLRGLTTPPLRQPEPADPEA